MLHDLRPLSAALAKKAEVELNENPADVDFYLQSLREWIQLQPNLKARTSDQFLIVFLRSCKFSLEKAKQKLHNFYKYRSLMPEIFKDRNLDDPKVAAIVHSGCLLHLPEPISADGPRVIMIRLNCFDMKLHSIPDVFQVGAMATDILLYEDDNAIVAGYELVMDLANIPKAVLLNFEASFVKKLTILTNKITPSRMKGFHFLNAPPVFEKLFCMVKSVIDEKLRERFYVYGSNYEALFERIPQRILPKEYGGEVDVASLQEKIWCKLKEQKDFIKEEEDYGIIKGVGDMEKDELDKFNDVFGVTGTFRQLSID